MMTSLQNKIFDAVVFYNWFGNGDLYESREFVKDIIKIIPAREYHYAHAHSRKILMDIPQLLQVGIIEETMQPMTGVRIFDNVVYINTWIGRDPKYVLPGVGCTLEKLYEMYNDILSELGYPSLPKQVIDYIPTFDWSYFKLGRVDDFVSEHPERKVLISNNEAQSCQAKNFDLNPAIEILCDTYPDTAFIICSPSLISGGNLYITKEIIQADDCDLVEIAYLSKFTDVIIGRNSAPHVFAQHRENWDDPTKASLSFTYKAIASHFVLNTPVQMKKYWCGVVDTEGVIASIKEVLER